ncbi:hypothetical protein BCR32DRAFT_244506 [Anaeromyces robustus]|uniref:G-protein coupled receptors family 3 profile domain-containing protein n=1 Tax=Anaeromyces robustus TaxID=1754192 RepID=A0A1Y1X9F7_9FUNG|nr:hypothetical protein BCR32DRAFT_244506 [Anaeromyces robustus]|eukprot:ORX81964.1 hypothetical protein BCR32DRAFT_244506 [Anaeromyces robustus]
MYDYDYYSEKFRLFAYEYIFGDKGVEEVLKNMNDITKIYYISISTKDSYVGLTNLIISIILIIIILVSTIFVFLESFSKYFEFISIDFWLVSIIGLIVLLSANFSDIGKVTSMKCHIKIILVSCGYTLNIIPFFHKLILNFPESNKFLYWLSKHRYNFLIFFLFMDCIFNSLLFIKPYGVKSIIVINGQNFESCETEHFATKFILWLLILSKFLIIILITGLLYLEWNIKETYYHIRLLTPMIYINFLLILIYVIISNYIKINDYTMYFVIRSFINELLIFTNYILMLGLRIIWGLVKNKNRKSRFITDINKKFINDCSQDDIPTTTIIKTNFFNTNETTINSISKEKGDVNIIPSISTSSQSKSKKSNVINKMIKYHNQTEVETNSIKEEQTFSKHFSYNHKSYIK